jgi:hypothetical protein
LPKPQHSRRGDEKSQHGTGHAHTVR